MKAITVYITITGQGARVIEARYNWKDEVPRTFCARCESYEELRTLMEEITEYAAKNEVVPVVINLGSEAWPS